jgi:probable metal-binding protein
MNNIRHIHEVLNMIYSTDKKYSSYELTTHLQDVFGEDVHFTSCSENVFPLNEVVPFLLSRNKIRLEDEVIIPLTPACNH